MRKSVLFIALAVLAAVSMQAKEERYTVFDENTGTLTYYYDDIREYRSGTVELYSASNPRFEGYNDRITRVVIDFTMRNDPSKVFFSLFRGNSTVTLKNVTEIVGLENLNTDGAEDMGCMFYGCSSLTEIDLSSFRTSNVRDMRYLFTNCRSLTKLDLRSFDVTKVSNMYGMFKGCTALQTILCDEDWSASETLVSHTDMFDGCSALKGNAGTAYNPNMKDKTYARPDGGAEAPGYFSQMRVYTVYADGTLTYYFDDQMATRSGEIELYPSVKDNHKRFETYHNDITKAVIDESMENAHLTTTAYMFSGGYYTLNNLTRIEGMEHLKTDEVTNMNSMFGGCLSLTAVDLSHFNTSNVTEMVNLFKQCEALKVVDLNAFDVHNVNDCSMMFDYCSSLTAIYCFKDWSLLSDKIAGSGSSQMFRGCTSLVGGSGTAYSEEHTNGLYARPDGGSAYPGYFTMGEWEGTEHVSQEPREQSRKLIKDGQLFILQGGKTYNVSGSEVQ